MSSINIPDAVARDLEERNAALLVTDQQLHSLENEATELRDRLDQNFAKARQVQAMKENILNDIALIEKTADAFMNASQQSQPIEIGDVSPAVAAKPVNRALSPACQTVLNALVEAGKPVKGLEVMGMTNLRKGTVAVSLRRLGEKGFAVNNDHKWSAVPP